MSDSAAVTVELDGTMLDDLDFVADWHGMSRKQVVTEAVSRLVAEEKRFADAFIQEGLDAADRGELIPHEEVMAALRLRAANVATPAAAE